MADVRVTMALIIESHALPLNCIVKKAAHYNQLDLVASLCTLSVKMLVVNYGLCMSKQQKP